MTSVTKNPQHPTKNFFYIANYKTFRVFWAFEQLSTNFGTRAQANLPWGVGNSAFVHGSAPGRNKANKELCAATPGKSV